MLFYAKQLESQAGKLQVDIPEAAVFIKKWLGAEPEFADLSMRWAAGRDMQGALLVIGVRHAGRGFDVAFHRDAWEHLREQPHLLTVRYQPDMPADNGEVNEWLELDVEIPDGSFRQFIAECGEQAQADPGKQILAEIAAFFKGM